MGLFSFITQDTQESIPCKGNGKRDVFTVIMRDDKGNTWTEPNYEGYGEFGGKDFFVLIAEMNGYIDLPFEEKRDKGNDLYYDMEDENIKYPNLNQYLGTQWKNERPKDCPDQGYFYQDDEDSLDEYYGY